LKAAESEDGMIGTGKVFADDLRVDLFAGFPVSEYAAGAAWYERLLGCPPAFLPNEVEAVWELAEHRYIFIKFQPEHAGHAFNLFFPGREPMTSIRAAQETITAS
jgi:hypothetical protein